MLLHGVFGRRGVRGGRTGVASIRDLGLGRGRIGLDKAIGPRFLRPGTRRCDVLGARLSDVVMITSDNPRGEDPQRIIDEVKRGADAETRQSSAEVLTIIDRHDAILRAISMAAKGDVVLIAGKGHETYQIVGKDVWPFDDRLVAREVLAGRAREAGGGTRC